MIVTAINEYNSREYTSIYGSNIMGDYLAELMVFGSAVNSIYDTALDMSDTVRHYARYGTYIPVGDKCRNCALNIHVGPTEINGQDATAICSCGCHDW